MIELTIGFDVGVKTMSMCAIEHSTQRIIEWQCVHLDAPHNFPWCHVCGGEVCAKSKASDSPTLVVCKKHATDAYKKLCTRLSTATLVRRTWEWLSAMHPDIWKAAKAVVIEQQPKKNALTYSLSYILFTHLVRILEPRVVPKFVSSKFKCRSYLTRETTYQGRKKAAIAATVSILPDEDIAYLALFPKMDDLSDSFLMAWTCMHQSVD